MGWGGTERDGGSPRYRTFVQNICGFKLYPTLLSPKSRSSLFGLAPCLFLSVFLIKNQVPPTILFLEKKILSSILLRTDLFIMLSVFDRAGVGFVPFILSKARYIYWESIL